MTKLNQRQERFCQNIFLGKTAADASILAGYSPSSAAVNTTKLLKNTNIIARIRELQEATTSDSVATVIKRKELLTEIAYGEHKEPITAQERIRAIAELNKMEGDYAPDKHAVLGDIEITIVHRDKGRGKDEAS